MTSKPSLLLHGFKLSGHSHRAELMLRLLGLSFDFHQVDLAGGEQKRPAFLALNPFGQVPVLEDGDVVVADSVAILVYLATNYDPARTWLPTDPAQAAQVQRWLSVAQGPVFNGPCSARLVKVFNADIDLARAQKTAHALFQTLDPILDGRRYLVGDGPTIADVALYSYIAHAPEGGVPLADYPNIRSWIATVESLPGFEAMAVTQAG
jgi:glutathione S-transferase